MRNSSGRSCSSSRGSRSISRQQHQQHRSRSRPHSRRSREAAGHAESTWSGEHLRIVYSSSTYRLELDLFRFKYSRRKNGTSDLRHSDVQQSHSYSYIPGATTRVSSTVSPVSRSVQRASQQHYRSQHVSGTGLTWYTFDRQVC